MHDIVISDTSCFIVLDKINRLDILRNVYDHVFTKPEIIKEFGKSLPEWIVVSKVMDTKFQVSLESFLGKGESSAIALAREIKNSILLIDEKKGRKIALENGIIVTGTPGVILKAKQSGHIPLILPLLEELKIIGFYIGKEIETRMLMDAGEL
jgi:predicted nucleic acid-binding protein